MYRFAFETTKLSWLAKFLMSWTTKAKRLLYSFNISLSRNTLVDRSSAR